MTVAPFAGPVRGLCNHYAQFGVLCAMEMAAGSCIWWAHSEDYATLQKPNGRILRWNRELVAKSDIAKIRRVAAPLEKPRRLLALIILIVAGCYLSGVAIYTFCIARARHRQHMVETKVDKLTDSWLVKMALSLYLLVAPPALLLSAWLGFGVHLGPKVGLKMFNLSFEQSRTGVRLFMASASIIFISLLWRLISLYYDIRHQSPKTAVELSDEY